LVDDFKILAKDVQELLKATASVVGDKATEARGRVQDSLKVAQDKLGDVHENVKAKGQEAFSATDGYVRDNPWNAVGIAAGQSSSIGRKGQGLLSADFLYEVGVVQHVALWLAQRDSVIVGVGFNIGLRRDRHRQCLATLEQNKLSVARPEIEQISRRSGIFLHQWERAFGLTRTRGSR